MICLDLRRVIKLAQLSDTLMTPNGINTIMGERAQNCPVVKDRGGIARALYNDPDILVFDEATVLLTQRPRANF